MSNRSYNFLIDTKRFLLEWEALGYDTCHKIEGYNVDECHQDCKRLEKSDFAKQCKKDGGLIKCCIRQLEKGYFGLFSLHYCALPDETRSTATSAATAALCPCALCLMMRMEQLRELSSPTELLSSRNEDCSYSMDKSRWVVLKWCWSIFHKLILCI